jgi:hypothetical protein
MLSTKTIIVSLAALATIGSGIIYQLSQQNKLAEESNGLKQGAAIEAQVQQEVNSNQAKKSKQLEKELVNHALGR